MIKSELGEVKVSKDVIDTIVKLATAEIESVSNFTKSGEKKRHLKSPKIDIENNIVDVDLYISLYYGSVIQEEVEKVQKNIISSVENMLSLKVNNVNVNVCDITPKEEE